MIHARGRHDLARGGDRVRIRFVTRSEIQEDADGGYLREVFHGPDAHAVGKHGDLGVGNFERVEGDVGRDVGRTRGADGARRGYGIRLRGSMTARGVRIGRRRGVGNIRGVGPRDDGRFLSIGEFIFGEQLLLLLGRWLGNFCLGGKGANRPAIQRTA